MVLELWCALYFLCFFHLYDFFLCLHSISCFSFSEMEEERKTRSTTSETSTNSYLYLHPGENPAASLVSPVLDSTNYHSWSRYIIMALSAKNKVEFVLGTRPCPPTSDPTYSVWIRCNNMVVSWLIHSISLLFLPVDPKCLRAPTSFLRPESLCLHVPFL